MWELVHCVAPISLAGENLLSQLVECSWHQIPAISPFRDCLSCSEAALAMVELWLVDMLNPGRLGSAHCCSAGKVLLQSSLWAAWLLLFFLISVSCQFLLPFPFFLKCWTQGFANSTLCRTLSWIWDIRKRAGMTGERQEKGKIC